MGCPRKSRGKKFTPASRSAAARKSLTVSAPPFPVGAKVEVKVDSDGFLGSWFDAIVTDHVFERDRVVRYKVQYTTLVKEDGDNPESPETDEIYVYNVRPEAPRRLKTTSGQENEEDEFDLHELVEGYHNEGWWYGVIFKLKNPETGKYTVSFPLSREVVDLSPEEIRQQLNYINGIWFPVNPKPQKFEKYKIGNKVDVVNIIKKYGASWFPATIEKIIGDDNYLIKYENINNPPKGQIYEIIDITALRPVLEKRTDNKIELNSHVEFYHGGWTNGVVTRVMAEDDYVVEFGEGYDVLSEPVNGEYLRVKFVWDGKKWSKFNKNSRKRRRADGSNKAPKKKQKNDISPSKKKSGSENSKKYARVKRAEVKKCPKSKLFNELDSFSPINMKTNMRRSDEDISNSPSNNPTSNNPNDLVLNQANPNPNEGILSREINDDIITLPFEKTSPLWKPLEQLGYFKKIPQTPHFNSLKRCCQEEREGKALGLAITLANLTNSIPNLSPDADLALIEQKLTLLNSLEQDGFKVDPLRTRLNSLIEIKKEISQRDLIKAEKKSALAQRLEDYNHDWNNILKVDAELAKVINEKRRLRDEKESFLERSVVNGEWINNLEREIEELERENELARERCLVTLFLE